MRLEISLSHYALMKSKMTSKKLARRSVSSDPDANTGYDEEYKLVACKLLYLRDLVAFDNLTKLNWSVKSQSQEWPRE